MKWTVILVVLVSLFTSCATIFTGTSQKVRVDSKPQGADVLVEGKKVGTTPAEFRIKRNVNDLMDEEKQIQFELAGYEKTGYSINAEFNPVAAINLFNLFAWAVDAATGAVTRYDEYTYVELRPEEKPKPSNTKKSEPSTSTAEEKEGEPKEITTKSNKEDKYDRLIKLKKLLDDGILTQEEFDREKAKILAED